MLKAKHDGLAPVTPKVKRHRYTKFGVNINTYVTPEFRKALHVQAAEMGYPNFASYIRRLLIEGSKRHYQYKDPYGL